MNWFDWVTDAIWKFVEFLGVVSMLLAVLGMVYGCWKLLLLIIHL